jgi:hypothetical protein
MAKYLQRLGHDVKVIAGKPTYLDTTLPLEIDEGNVLYVDELKIFGRKLGHLGLAKPGLVEGGSAAKSFNFTWLKSLIKLMIFFPDRQRYWSKRSVIAAERLLNDWKPDMIFASHAPISNLRAAAKLSERHGISCVAEFRDLWSGNPYAMNGYIYSLFQKFYENKVIKQFSSVVGVTRGIRDRLECRYPNKAIHLIFNGADPEDLPTKIRKVSSNGFNVVYAGSLYDGDRNIKPFMEAMAQINATSEIKVFFHYYGPSGDYVKNIAIDCAVSENTLIGGVVSYKESIAIQSSADALLLVITEKVGNESILTGKVFEYLLTGRPIISLATKGSELDLLVQEAGHNPAVRDVESIRRQLVNMINGENCQSGFSNIAKGKAYTREAAAKKLELVFQSVRQ